MVRLDRSLLAAAVVFVLGAAGCTAKLEKQLPDSATSVVFTDTNKSPAPVGASPDTATTVDSTAKGHGFPETDTSRRPPVVFAGPPPAPVTDSVKSEGTARIMAPDTMRLGAPYEVKIDVVRGGPGALGPVEPGDTESHKPVHVTRRMRARLIAPDFAILGDSTRGLQWVEEDGAHWVYSVRPLHLGARRLTAVVTSETVTGADTIVHDFSPVTLSVRVQVNLKDPAVDATRAVWGWVLGGGLIAVIAALWTYWKSRKPAPP